MSRSKPTLVRALGVAATLGDAALAFHRGRKWSGLFLTVMAALSVKVTGLGTVGSLAVRLNRAR